MSENKRYCMGCMEPVDEHTTICPNCHYSTDLGNKASHIAQGSTVSGRYLIGKTVATYNDSAIYIGLDKTTEKTVTVYEFFPEKIASRDTDGCSVIPSQEKKQLYDSCLQSFLGLWRGIKMFDDVRCLPTVTDIFRENGTAYAVSEYKNTVALKDYFAKTRRPLNPNKAVSAFLPLLNALKLLHNAGIIHGNITPSTIQVGADGRLNLIGFSIPQCRSDIPELAAKPVSGFSPLEIYQGGTARNQSDIYSVMSVFYYAVTGIVLPRATERVSNSKLSMPSAVVQNVPRPVLDALSRSLAVQPTARPSKAEELIALLTQAKKASAAPAPERPVVAASAPAAREEVSNYAAPDYNGETQAMPVPAAEVKRPSAVKKAPVKEYEDDDSYEYDEDEDKDDTVIAKKEIPLPLLGSLTCVAVIIICFILFAVLYSTVLYKSIEVPMFDNMFSSFTFLPMNKDKDADSNITDDLIDDDTQDTTVNGTTYVTVPDFTKFNEDYIRANVTFLNNFDIIYDYQSSTEVEKGGVISQSVNKNESVLTGTQIRLVISTGQPEIVVPDVLEKPYDEAKKILQKEGFKVKKEVIENPDKNPADTVSNMSIEPGMLAEKGSEITLYVWDKPEEETTEPTTTAPTTTEPTTTEPTTTKPTTTKPTTTKPTTTEPITTEPTTTEPAAADTPDEGENSVEE